MVLFVERLDGKLVNISLVQTVFVDPDDLTDVIWYMKNGETYREDLVTEEEAQNRYNDIKGLLLGTTIAELEERITEQQQTIAEQAQTIEDNATTIQEQTETIQEQTETIAEQVETIQEQTETIQEQTQELNSLNRDINALVETTIDINGEEITNGGN